MVKRIVLATARIILGILTLKVTYNNLYYFMPTCYILKTRIIANKIYTRRLSTATRMYNSSWCNVKKNCLISKP